VLQGSVPTNDHIKVHWFTVAGVELNFQRKAQKMIISPMRKTELVETYQGCCIYVFKVDLVEAYTESSYIHSTHPLTTESCRDTRKVPVYRVMLDEYQ